VNGQTIQDLLSDPDETNLLVFLRALDGRTTIFESDADLFKDPTRGVGP